MSARGAAVTLRGVTKTFGPTVAVSDLDLSVPRGALYGFIGPNGAGKTTSIRLIMSILFPDAGEIEVLGHASALEAKDRIGYLPEERGVYRKMRVGAYLAYIARLKGVAPASIPERVAALLERVQLGAVVQRRCEELSKGMLQKIQFVAAIVHEPDLLILDEPFSGLDPISMRLLRDLIVAEHGRGATILFSTHVMPQAEDLCDRVVMFHRGRKVLDDPLSAIRRRYDARTIVFEPLEAEADLRAVESWGEIEAARAKEGSWELVLKRGVDPTAVMRRLIGTRPAARIELKRPRLEDVFVQLVESGDAPTEAGSLRAELGGTRTAEAV